MLLNKGIITFEKQERLYWILERNCVVFAVVIALCGCYFGLTCGRNADSVGKSTTNAVVYAIVWMIVMTGLITLACEGLGV